MVTFRGKRLSEHALAMTVVTVLVMTSLSLHASGKKKVADAPDVKAGDQRVTAYFDVSKIVWPNPPAIARIKFIDLFTGEKIDPSLYEKKKQKQKWMDRLAGTQNVSEIKVDTLPFQLIRTYGVANDSKGRIYVADQGVGAIFIFDPEHKDKVELIANGRQAHFAMITGLAMDDNDHLFVSDSKLRRIDIFNANHELEGQFGNDVLVNPAGIAIDRDNRFLYVVDTGLDVVDVFDADSYKLLRKIGKESKKHEATDPGLFSLPTAVAVDRDGNVYVTDTFNNRIQIFDPDGQFITAFGKNGDGPGELERPKGIAVDVDDHIWVVDAAQNRVKVFNREGQLLIYFGAAGAYPGQFNGPWGIAIDNSNRVFVSETYPGRVQMFRYVTDSEAAELRKQKEANPGKTKLADARTNGSAGGPGAQKDSATSSANVSEQSTSK